MTFSLDQLMLQDQPSLDSSQLFVLKSAIQNIDNFFTILQNPNLAVKKKQEIANEVSNNRFSIQGN
jgi:predicted HAD superfamily hydrolase